ncbi:branched-chain amino acid ABC transporter permease [Pseudoroseomonas rhizosphaerae]|uniref:Branched-chain amino acid ABC transporter permease n=1 Tax=Teichococcus rhizosphaerae TaxID=1335062 RepID=A0A2C7AAY5_9PROT|nr:branched-chain amino acid ABC transporter permease [Pseudoroseomonas rhizosphaerae]PHK95219.1 branched-chain amino acid ABC transporter permease [Pseudoroseomonas rhizosphaerae]
MLFLQLFISGLQTGAIYALTAAGFALIFGATRVFHVAHGATFALAGYAYLACTDAGLPWPAGALAALVLAVAFGLAMDAFIYRPIQRHEGSFFTVFVAAFGMSIVVQSVIELVFGRGFVTVSSALTMARQVAPGIYLADIFWVAAGVAIALFVLVTLFLERTRAGIGLRALSENPELLRAYGLSSRRLSAMAFGLGSALAVPGAILTTMTSGLQPAISHQVMLISLAAAVVGGIGSLRGAALAGLLLGVVENLVIGVLDTQWSAAAGFVVLFAFILFKPSGLFGQAVTR